MKTFTEWLGEKDKDLLDEALTGWKKALALGLVGAGIGAGGYFAGRQGTEQPIQNQTWTSPHAAKFLQDEPQDTGGRPLSRAEQWKLRMSRLSAERAKGTSRELQPQSNTSPSAGNFLP